MSLTHQLYLQRIREIEDLSAEGFDAYRGPVVARFLDHMWREVPFYRTRLAPFVDGGRFDLAAWCDVPLLRPREVAAAGGEMRAGSVPVPAKETEDVAGNGFLQVPCRSRLSRLAAECERERFYERNDVELGETLAVLHPDHAADGASGTGWSITFDRSRWIAGDATTDGADQRSWLSRTHARQLRTSLRIAEGLASDGRLDGIALILIVEDFLPPASRRQLEEALGARVVHIAERPVIGPCAADSGRGKDCLVPAASNVVEVVDRNGRPAAPGSPGEIAITPLYEYAFPLLRLATGLFAVAPAKPGTILGVRSLPAMAGRISE